MLVYETHDYQIKIEATFHLIFGACINILVMFKVKILVLLKWIIEVPLIMFTIELGMVINIGKTNVNDFNDPKTSRYIDMHVCSSSPSPFRWGLGSKEDLVWLIGGPLVSKCSL